MDTYRQVPSTYQTGTYPRVPEILDPTGTHAYPPTTRTRYRAKARPAIDRRKGGLTPGRIQNTYEYSHFIGCRCIERTTAASAQEFGVKYCEQLPLAAAAAAGHTV